MIKLHVGNELMRKISMIYVCVQLRGVNQQTSSVLRGSKGAQGVNQQSSSVLRGSKGAQGG
jgi:hypothetical protein